MEPPVSGGGAIRPLPRDGGVEKLYGGPTVGPRPKVWIRNQRKNGAPKIFVLVLSILDEYEYC